MQIKNSIFQNIVNKKSCEFQLLPHDAFTGSQPLYKLYQQLASVEITISSIALL